MSRIGYIVLALLAIVNVVYSTPATGLTTTNTQPDYAYVAVYTAGAPDSAERLLGIRVMVKTLQITRTPYDIVILVSRNTEQSVRDSFTADGFKVVEMADPQSSSSSSDTGVSNSAFSANQATESTVALANSQESTPSYYQQSCPYNHDWHYVFTLTQYKRVVFVEHDSLVFLNLDDLFKCGKFCMVYANDNCWNSGVIVVEPSIAEFRRWQAHYNTKASALEKARQSSWSHSVRCVEQWHDSLLTMYPTIEASPLFHTSQIQSEEPIMRLHLMYSINAIFYYEHYNWALYTLNINIPEDSSALKYKRMASADGSVHVGIPTDVPAFSMAHHNPKPYLWWPAGFLDLNFDWSDIRYMLYPAETNRIMLEVAVSRLALLVIMYFACQHIMQRMFTQIFREKMLEFWVTMRVLFPILPTTQTAPSDNDCDEEDIMPVKEKDEENQIANAKLKNLALNSGAPLEHIRDISQLYTSATQSTTSQCLYQVDSRCRAQIAGLLLAATAIGVLTWFLAIPLVPSTTPPTLAWPLCCLFQNLFLWVAIKVLINVFPSASIVQNYEAYDPKLTSFIAPFVLEMIAIAHNRAHLHTHFVHKILAFEIFLTLIFLLQARDYRKFVLSHYGYATTSTPAHKVLSADLVPSTPVPRVHPTSTARLGHEEP